MELAVTPLVLTPFVPLRAAARGRAEGAEKEAPPPR